MNTLLPALPASPHVPDPCTLAPLTLDDLLREERL